MNERVELRNLPGCPTLTYAQYGDPEGRPLLFCHGWPSSRLQARGLHEVALEQGIRLIAPDRPGIGGTSYRPGRTLLDWPPLAAAFADRLGLERFEVMGVSGGGPYALALGARLGDRVRQVTLVCPAPPLSWQRETGGLHWAYRSLIRVRKTIPWALAAPLGFARWISRRPPDNRVLNWFRRGLPDSDRQWLATTRHRDIVGHDYREAMRSPNRALITEGDLYLQPWGFDPGEVIVPTILWHGTADTNLPLALVQRLAREIPRCQAHWIEHEGHYSILHTQVGQILL